MANIQDVMVTETSGRLCLKAPNVCTANALMAFDDFCHGSQKIADVYYRLNRFSTT